MIQYIKILSPELNTYCQTEYGPTLGYYPELSKSWLIVKNAYRQQAQKSMEIQIYKLLRRDESI